MRIGILTFHRAHNCGAMLQAWALKKTLERMGHAVEFPACNSIGVGKLPPFPLRNVLSNLFSFPCENIRQHRYNKFRKRFLSERDCGPRDFDRYYDLLISGSDQVFSIHHTGDEASLFLCENKPANLRAITYAASYGDKPLEGERLARVTRALANFEAVSMRETLSREQMARASGRDIAETLDPTLLVDASDYGEIASGTVPKEPYLFMYTLEAKPFYVDTAKELARRMGVKCVIAPCYSATRWRAPKGLTFSISPERLVQYVRHAKYVLAGSFHGTVMGVVFGKPFLSLREQVDEYESRPASLLRKLGCSERLVNPTTSLDEMERLLREPLPDYAAALEKERVASLEWLRKGIGSR